MNKNFYNIDDISQIIGEQKHTIRFWESRISKLNVIRTQSGHRLYDYENLLLLKKIKYLLEVQKLTLEGVNDYLSKSKLNKKSLNKDIFLELKDVLSLLKK
jgi:DNA-binding transcriptional MerR regulator